MELELRHTEKNILYHLLMADSFEDIQKTIAGLMATMESVDVENVQRRVAEAKKKQ